MNLRKNQSGFSPVEIILVIGLLIALVAVGWLVYDRQQSKKDSVSTTSQQQEVPHGGDESGLGDADTAPADTYLSIKEWGVKIPVSGDISDAYYAMNEGFLYLSKGAYKNTGCAAESGGLGVITRFSESEKNNEANSPLVSSAVKINGYYYAYISPQAACEPGPMHTAEFKAAVDKITTN